MEILESEKNRNIDSMIRKHFKYLKEGDFSVLTTEEVDELILFIRSFVIRYKCFRGEVDDITSEIFVYLMTNKLFNLDKSYDNLTTYLGSIIKAKLNNILQYRSYDKRKVNYNKDSLDEIIGGSGYSTQLDKLQSTIKGPYEEYLIHKNKEIRQLVNDLVAADDLMKMYYIDKRTYEEIGKKYNITVEGVRFRLNRAKAFLKIQLAEMGGNDILNSHVDDNYLSNYLAKRINDYGVSAVIVADDVELNTIAKFIDVDEKYIHAKLTEDKKRLFVRMNDCGVGKLNTTIKYQIRDMYMYILATKLKDIENLPKDIFMYVEQQIEKSKFISDKFYLESKASNTRSDAYEKYFKENNITKEEFDQKIEEELFDIKCDVENYLKTYKYEATPVSQVLNHIKSKNSDEKQLTNISATYRFQRDFSGYQEEYLPIINEIVKKYEFLSQFVNSDKTITQISKEVNKTAAAVLLVYEKDMSSVKFELAEKGIFDENYSKDLDKEYVNEIRESIVKYGITGTSIIKDINSYELGKILNIKTKFLDSRIFNDTKDINDLFKKNKVVKSLTPKSFNNIMIKTLKMSKDKLFRVPEGQLLHTRDEILNNKFLNQFFVVQYSDVMEKYVNQGYSKQDVKDKINFEVDNVVDNFSRIDITM